jgi:hypothetical protein
VYGDTPWNGMDCTNLSKKSIEENYLKMSADDLLKEVAHVDAIKATSPFASKFSTTETNFIPDTKIDDLSKPNPNIAPEKLTEFKMLTMKAMYIAIKARPDILCGCVMLSGKQASPTDEDFKSIKRILKYVSNTRSKSLKFKSKGKMRIRIFCDASHNCYVDGMGHGGIVIYLDDYSSPIFWRSKKMSVITKNTLDTEAVILSEGSSHALALVKMFSEMEVIFEQVPIIYEDQEKLVEKILSPRITKTAQTKFSNQQWHFTHKLVLAKELEVAFVRTVEQKADGLTKPLVGQLFNNSDKFFFT